jgi:hypothetical protein
LPHPPAVITAPKSAPGHWLKRGSWARVAGEKHPKRVDFRHSTSTSPTYNEVFTRLSWLRNTHARWHATFVRTRLPLWCMPNLPLCLVLLRPRLTTTSTIATRCVPSPSHRHRRRSYSRSRSPPRRRRSRTRSRSPPRRRQSRSRSKSPSRKQRSPTFSPERSRSPRRAAGVSPPRLSKAERKAERQRLRDEQAARKYDAVPSPSGAPMFACFPNAHPLGW